MGKEIIVGIRPEDMEDPALAGDAPADRELTGKVELTEALGSEIMVHFSIDAAHAVTEDVADLQKDIGTDRAPGSGIGSEGAGRRARRALRPALARQGRRHDPGRRRHALASLFRSPDVSRDLRLILPKGDHVSRLRISLLVLVAAIASLTALATTAGATSHKKYAVSGNLSWVGIWSGAEQKNFQKVLDAFQKKNPGVKVKYTSAGDNVPTVLSTAVAGGNPPDLASIGQPGLVKQFAAAQGDQADRLRQAADAEVLHTVVDHPRHVERKALRHGLQGRQQVDDLVLGLGLQERGREAARDLDAAARRRQDAARLGHARPSRSTAVTAGPLTDIFENVYIRTAGASKYDLLAAHRIKWTDPSVKMALKTMAQIFGDTGNIYGGTSGALQALLADSVNDVFSTPPKAAMTIEGDFVPTAATVKAKPLTGYNVFPFPSINGSPPSVVGGGDTVVMFKDTPAARALISYLATPRGGHDLGQAGRLLLAQQGRAGKRVSGRAHPHDRDGAGQGEDLPVRHVRPRSGGLRRHGGSGRVEDPAGLPEEPQGHRRHRLEARDGRGGGVQEVVA